MTHARPKWFLAPQVVHAHELLSKTVTMGQAIFDMFGHPRLPCVSARCSVWCGRRHGALTEVGTDVFWLTTGQLHTDS